MKTYECPLTMLKASPVTRCLTQAIAFAMSLVSTGCCRTYYPSLPSRPTETSGWNHKAIETSLTIGSFVLAKSESTESDKLGVGRSRTFEALCRTPIGAVACTTLVKVLRSFESTGAMRDHHSHPERCTFWRREPGLRPRESAGGLSYS